MTSFLDLDESLFRDATVIVDVDGTLVSDRSRILGAPALEKLQRLSRISRVFLCSNGSPDSARDFAVQAGVKSFSARKPFPGAARALVRPGERLIVVGDKFITDGIFAALLGAEFVRVPHIRTAGDSLFARATYVLDGYIWKVSPFIHAMRPWQWTKNLLVFAPAFFAGVAFDAGHFMLSVWAFLSFSFTASMVYVFNDLVDRERDRMHPKKRLRPIASGRLSEHGAYTLLAVLGVCSVLSVSLIPSVSIPLAAYVLLNIAYSASLKHVAVVDVTCIAAFYLLRIIAGGVAAGVPLSPWIVLCAMFGSLFIIIGKRRAEVHRAQRRAVLEEYSSTALDFMLVASASLAIMTYGIYSVIGHHSPYLVYSTAFVAFALFRMLNHMYTHPEDAETPELLVFKDRWILGSFVGWAAYAFVIFYVI